VPDLTQLLHHLLERRGSDLHLKVGSPPYVRVDGHLEAVPAESCSAGELERIAAELVPSDRSDELADRGQLDFAHSVPGLGRFRVNLHRQRGSYGIVVRRVQPGMPSLDQLNLPVALRRLSEEHDGLIIVSGSPGSGRSTTVAMLVDRINENRAANIVTIEDPIEFLHIDKRSIVTQREVGSDTPSFAEGASRVLRQDPDVVFLGEIPDPETAAAALLAASNGRLVLAAMATTPAPEVIERLVDFFPPHQQRQTRQTIASCLRGIVCQRLVERADGRGRVPAVEVLMSTPRVVELIADPGRAEGSLEQAIAEGEYYGMQTIDQSLFQLFREGLVGLRDALAAATRPEDLRIAIQTSGMAMN
jgi:twitching motility protein PilT